MAVQDDAAHFDRQSVVEYMTTGRRSGPPAAPEGGPHVQN
jgi:hypothetical protein